MMYPCSLIDSKFTKMKIILPTSTVKNLWSPKGIFFTEGFGARVTIGYYFEPLDYYNFAGEHQKRLNYI